MAFLTLDFETYFETRRPRDIPSLKDGGRKRFSLTDRTYEEYILDPLFQVHCCSFQVDDGKPYCVWGEDAVRAELERLFPEGNDHTLLAHNALFDAAIFSWYFGRRAARYQDTLMMSLGIWPQRKAGLKALAKRVFPNDESLRKGGDELADVAGLRTDEIDDVDCARLMRYDDQDVNLTFRIYRELWRVYPDEELDLIDWTVRIFAHPPFDLDRPRLQSYLDRAQQELAETIEASGVAKTTLNSNKKFAEWLEEKHDIEVDIKQSPTPANPDNETWALAKSDLSFIEMQRQHPELDHVWKAKIACGSTIHIARARRMLDHHDAHDRKRIALGLVANAAHTKRWGGTNRVNPQNFPRGGEHRKSIIAPKDHLIVVRDLSNIEGRVNAWNSGEEWKMRAFAEGVDLYNDLASDIYGRPIERKRTETDPKTGEVYHPDFEEGFVGKTAELGLGYQAGSKTLRLSLATGNQARILIPHDEAEHIKNTWRNKNARIVDYWKQCERVIFDMASPRTEPYDFGVLRVEHQRLVLPNGMALTYPKLALEDPDDPRSGFSYWQGHYFTNLYGGKLTENIVQALAKIILAQHLLEIDAWLLSEFPGTEAQVGLTVHDEVVAVAPENHAEEVLDYMGEVMSVCPNWCDDGSLVLASEGGIAREYSK